MNINRKIDKRNNPNLGLFQNAKGTFESPLDIPLIVNGKEMTVIELLSMIVKTQVETERDFNAFKETFKKVCRGGKHQGIMHCIVLFYTKKR